MYITVINDCKSQDDIARQETRLASLFPETHITFFGVSADFSVEATLEAAGGLVDILDAANGRKGYILLNVAPRGDVAEDGLNGTPFCYFHYGDTTVISTIKGHALSLVKKLDLVSSVELLSVDAVMDEAVNRSLIDADAAAYVRSTQFRSYEFTPRVAAWLEQGIDLPSSAYALSSVSDLDGLIWYIDDFGNCKTTLIADDVACIPGSSVSTNIGTFMFYERLKDLPTGETGMYFGSSGIGSTRFVELATQKVSGSAAASLNLAVGDQFTILD